MIFYQVNKAMLKNSILGAFRYLHNGAATAKVLHPLENRKLLKVAGDDVSGFLQGLITNDMRHFEEGSKSMYAMFLNNKGRVLYDTLIYKWTSDDAYLLECDCKSISALERHLKLFKLRRRLDIGTISNEYNLWVLTGASEEETKHNVKDVHLYKDPRLNELGYRLVAPKSLSGSEISNAIDKNIHVEDNADNYTYLRYKLGVSEGTDDLPPASSFPLEANCDYLHGVSFHKGCYIGQEVTARVHHTGVVRKRIMPIKFTKIIQENLGNDLVILERDKPKSNLGKLRGHKKDYGLGLLRIKEACDAQSLVIGEHSAEAMKPNWWPKEAPKEKLNVTKLE